MTSGEPSVIPNPSPPRFTDVVVAHRRIHSHIRRTPTLSFPELDELCGASLFLKCENLQVVGAFKARGACNAVLSLSDAAAQQGVVTHSSGNHAAALAWAAQLRNIDVTVVMPENSRRNKIDAVRRLGCQPMFCEPTTAARKATARAVVERTGAILIHPYDDPRVIAGQGTAAMEMFEEVGGLDTLIAPVGGGGLLAGTLLVRKAVSSGTEVIGAEPALADDAWRSWKSGRLEAPLRYDTIADGLRTSLGRHTFPLISHEVDDIVRVGEESIIGATRAIIERTRLVVEPSAAIALASVLDNPKRFHKRRVGLLISGGNLDLDHLPWLDSPMT